MLVIFLVVAGALGLCFLVGFGIGKVQHLLTTPRPQPRLETLTKSVSPNLHAASLDGEVDVGPAVEPKAPQAAAPAPTDMHSSEPSLAQALAMEHVNS